MKFANATDLNRKSGEAEGSAVPRTTPGNVFLLGFFSRKVIHENQIMAHRRPRIHPM